MNSLRSYIEEKNKGRREYQLYGNIPLVIKDYPTSEEVDFDDLVEEINTRIPLHLMQNIDIVYIGQFPELADRNAVYADGAIYITNEEPTTYDILEDMIHEIAHATETTYASHIYDTDALQNEFLSKRKKLKSVLDSQGFTFPEKYYMDSEYSKSFDEFLSDGVGYPTLLNLTMGLFASPYGATSLREYFANGFEKYYLGEANLVKQVSPVLYRILNGLHKESDNI